MHINRDVPPYPNLISVCDYRGTKPVYPQVIESRASSLYGNVRWTRAAHYFYANSSSAVNRRGA
jgi:hypothetical protein